MQRPCRWAPMPSPRRLPPRPQKGMTPSRDRAQRLARHAVARAAGRGRDRRRAASPTGPVIAQLTCRPLQGEVPEGRRAQALPRAHRGDPLLQEAGAADVRPLRHHRSAVDRGIPRARRLRGPHQGARPWTPPTSSPRSRRRACAAAAAPASPPASSGRRSSTPRPTRNTSAAMRMKATAAPSPTAC